MEVHAERMEKNAQGKWEPTGKFGSLGQEELSEFINAKCPRLGINVAKSLASFVIGHDGKAGQGSGATTIQYNLRPVFHETSRHGGGTIFFAESQPGVATILGLGQHTGLGTNTYNLYWTHSKWNGRRHIVL